MSVEESEQIRVAVEALNGLRSGSVSTSALSSSRRTSLSCSSTLTETDVYSPMTSLSDFHQYKFDQDEAIAQEHFLERVSQLPLVSSAFRAYEASKNSSRVVKYGTDLVETSLQATLSRVVSPQQVNQLDEFACRQLNRFTPPQHLELEDPNQELRHRQRLQTASPDHQALVERSPSSSRSKWQTVLVQAGGIGAAVSEESMRSLKFCLVLLGTATHSLQTQIHSLREFILSLSIHQRQAKQLALPPSEDSARQQEEMLHSFKADILSTVKKAVDIISTYAGAALPEPAKKVVKEAILSLPANWARTVQAKNQQLVFARQEDRLTLMQEASERVLTFAVEGIDVLNGVAQIFGDTVERAEAWLQRLQTLGLSSQKHGQIGKALKYTSQEAAEHEQREEDGMAVDIHERQFRGFCVNVN